MLSALPKPIQEFMPILGLLIVVIFVIARLPKIELGHSDAFRKRRVFNWLPLGLTYAFFYMGRYNLTVAKNALGDLGLMSIGDFGAIFAAGTITYGVSFVINGPLADKLGGRKTILIGALGAALMNVLMGWATYLLVTQREAGLGAILADHTVLIFSLLYAVNMYFQSFGAVSIVKVNAAWFHVRERGVFGGIFGILISLGVYFAFDWGRMIVDWAKSTVVGTTAPAPIWYVFWIPAALLIVFFILDWFLVQDTPGEAGVEDFDTADASSGDDGPRKSVVEVAKMMLQNPVILTIGAIEFCSGFLRNAIMHWYIIFAKRLELMDTFIAHNWGLMLCMAGILGGVFAGVISDRVFQSRRGPSAGILYAVMVVGSLAMIFALDSVILGFLVIFMSLSIIGVHGMLSGTASMDFGGKKNVGVAVGLIDGLVYLGTGLQSVLLGHLLSDAGKDPSDWIMWPIVMLPVAVIGFVLTLRIWNAKPKGQKQAAH